MVDELEWVEWVPRAWCRSNSVMLTCSGAADKADCHAPWSGHDLSAGDGAGPGQSRPSTRSGTPVSISAQLAASSPTLCGAAGSTVEPSVERRAVERCCVEPLMTPACYRSSW